MIAIERGCATDTREALEKSPKRIKGKSSLTNSIWSYFAKIEAEI